MITRLYLLAALFLFSGFLHSCSCSGYSHSFSLADYDEAFDVLEIKFFEIVELGISPVDYREQKIVFDSLMMVYRSRPKNEKLVPPPPPPPPPPPRFKVLIRGELLRTFKGEIKSDTLLFRTNRSGGACGWIPNFDNKYIVYVGEPTLDDGVEAIGLSLCQRKTGIIWGVEEYNAERSILQSLSDCKDGIIAPVETIREKEFVPFIGHFKDGKRDGLWTIFKPIYWWRDSFSQDTPVFNLQYSNGEIVGVKVLHEILPGTPWRSNRWQNWALFYQERKRED